MEVLGVKRKEQPPAEEYEETKVNELYDEESSQSDQMDEEFNDRDSESIELDPPADLTQPDFVMAPPASIS